MDQSVKAMLAYATAAPGPFMIRVHKPDGSSEDQEVQAPFAIIGRGPGCDIVLEESTVSSRHVYLQAIGSRVACIDLLSTAGIRTNDPQFRGWLSPQTTLQIGSNELQLLGKKWEEADASLKTPMEFRPRDESRPEYGLLPVVELELLNTQHQGMKWPINRVITLVGSDDRCRITVSDDRVSRVQCALLLLPSGLWVVNMLGKGGIQLNGEVVACGHLSAGAELTIGPYKLAAHYPEFAKNLAPQQAIQASESEFLTRSNRIYQTQSYQDTIVVTVMGDAPSYLYQEVHVESNRVLDVISQRKYNHLVVDFSRVPVLNHVAMEGLMNICRSIEGKSAFCGATPEVYALLQSHSTARLYSHYASLHEALLAVYVPK
ncbi:FHA domain-containing protein [Planctomicrobium sp. SH668]|uniref:FHA domain-containing protein n=1 Tax=Planctomicrobium sp. SH668 TaxID=3448126 RepID=UPI003F5AEA47